MKKSLRLLFGILVFLLLEINVESVAIKVLGRTTAVEPPKSRDDITGPAHPIDRFRIKKLVGLLFPRIRRGLRPDRCEPNS